MLRRYGPDKATVVDVARALDISHGSVYRHFPSKAALRDAVMARWLARVEAPLAAIAAERGDAPARLYRWLDTLRTIKRAKVHDDPEMFATYHALAQDAREVVAAHMDAMAADVARIVSDGVAQGVYHTADPLATARAILAATSRFHAPAHAAEWTSPGNDAAFNDVWALIEAGLRARGRSLAPRPCPRRRTPEASATKIRRWT